MVWAFTICQLITASDLGVGPMPIAVPMAAFLAAVQPDTNKATPLNRWPNKQDLTRLRSLERQAKWMVLMVLGHPSAVERQPEDLEVWLYPWVAYCSVTFKNGFCVWTFYSAGY